MKICANLSLLFTEYSLPDRFLAARDSGFVGVEIQFPYDTPLIELIDAGQQSDLPVVLINVPAGDLMSGGLGLACQYRQRDAFKRAIDQCLVYAQALNVDCVNVLAGRSESSQHWRRDYDTFLGNLDYAADQLREIGVKAVFEAINTHDMPGFLIHSTAHMQQVILDLNHTNVAMQYDVYHMARMGEPVTAQLPELIHQVGHMQIADTPNRHQPGSGDIRWQELFATLHKLDYRQWIGAEYKPTGKTQDTLQWLQQDWLQGNTGYH